MYAHYRPQVTLTVDIAASITVSTCSIQCLGILPSTSFTVINNNNIDYMHQLSYLHT